MNDDPFVIGGIVGCLIAVVVSLCCWNARKERIERREAHQYREQVRADFLISLENFNKKKEDALRVPQ